MWDRCVSGGGNGNVWDRCMSDGENGDAADRGNGKVSGCEASDGKE